MLAIKPNCENCNKLLPPHSIEAMICSFECTFCVSCVNDILLNVCPNCGGGFYQRPVRPQKNWCDHASLQKYPASDKVVYCPVDIKKHSIFSLLIKKIPPHER